MTIVARVRAMISNMHAVYALDVGLKLGLFDQLASQQPINLVTFTNQTSYPPRYVTAWTRAVQAAGVVQVDEGGLLSFHEGWKDALTNPDSSEYIGSLPSCYTSIAAAAYPKYPALFRDHKMLDWRSLGEGILEDVYADGRRFANYFVSSVIDKVPELSEKLNSGAIVYDVGCGDGSFTGRLAEAFPNAKIIGIDPWSSAIELAKTKWGHFPKDRLNFKTMCVTELPSGVADIIIFNEVLHEMDRNLRAPALRSLRAALKTDGWMFITDPLMPSTHADYISNKDQAMMIFSEAALVPSDPLTRTELEDLLKQTGFGEMIDMEPTDKTVLSAFVKAI